MVSILSILSILNQYNQFNLPREQSLINIIQYDLILRYIYLFASLSSHPRSICIARWLFFGWRSANHCMLDTKPITTAAAAVCRLQRWAFVYHRLCIQWALSEAQTTWLN